MSLSWLKKGWRQVVVFVLLVVGVAVGLVLTVHATEPQSEVTRGGCAAAPARVGPRGARPVTTAVERRIGRGTATVKLREGQKLSLAFGRSTSARTITVLLDQGGTLGSPAVALNTRVDQFIRDDDAPLRSQNIVATARSDGQSIVLAVCFGRQHDHLGDPGTYTGSVTLDDNRMVAPVTIPVTVTLQYVHGVVLLWLLFLTVVPGAWVLWVVHSHREPQRAAFALGKLVLWLITVDGLVSVVVGGAAAFAVYSATYLRDPTWGNSALQALTLYGAMFSAFVTSAGITQISRVAAGPQNAGGPNGGGGPGGGPNGGNPAGAGQPGAGGGNPAGGGQPGAGGNSAAGAQPANPVVGNGQS